MKIMKKLMCCVLCVIMAFSVFSVNGALAAENGKCGDNLTWKLDDNGTLTISGTGEMDDWDYGDMPPWWGEYVKNVKTAVIENGVTSIGDKAFYYCEALTNITIPNSVTSIGECAFSFCSSLTSVTIPNGVTNIGLDTFRECESLFSVSIPDSVVNIDELAFSGCSSLTAITIPGSVASIGECAFSGCKSLTSVTIGNSVRSIGDSAFSGCEALTDITIPNSVESIASGAFEYCKNLTSVAISNGVTSIGSYAFYGCTNLMNITIPNSIKEIDIYSFSGCKNLKGITLPNDLEYIGTGAFNDCNSLKSIVIPKGVKTLGGFVFLRCDNLTSITVDKDNSKFSSINGVLFDKNQTKLIQYPVGKSDETYVIPDSVKYICDGAFFNCKSLKSITIPASVTLIGENSSIQWWPFSGCSNLTCITVDKNNASYSSLDGVLFNKDKTVLLQYPINKSGSSYTIPNSVKKIGLYTPGADVFIDADAFQGCRNLTNITIPNSVTYIGRHAFLNCRNMKSIIIPNSVTHIGEYALGYYEAYNEEMGYYPEVMSDFTIYGQKGSEAEKYSELYDVKFAVYSHTHSYKSAVTKKATCTANGVMTYTCSCGHKYTRTIKATGHKYTTLTSKATATRDGSVITKCTVCGAVKSKTVIAKASSVKLSKTSFTYNGKTQKPSVTVKDSKGKTLKNGTDYTVKYSSGCKNVGQYTVTITFKGKYSGTKTLTFKIVPKGTSISKLTAGKKQFTAKWSKQTAQTTGYELQYSTKSSMSGAKTVNVSKNKTTSSTVKKLKSGKKYYVRVRTYKTVKVNGKSVKLYSSWSKVKSVKTK